jgi:hypothetical protein
MTANEEKTTADARQVAEDLIRSGKATDVDTLTAAILSVAWTAREGAFSECAAVADGMTGAGSDDVAFELRSLKAEMVRARFKAGAP